MIDLLSYFEPVQPGKINASPEGLGQSFIDQVTTHRADRNDPDPAKADIIIVGYPNDAQANVIRSYLWGLSAIQDSKNIIDLGNFKNGKNAKDTTIGWLDVLAELGKAQKTIIILGGGNTAVEQLYQAYARLEQTISLAVVSPDLHLTANPDRFGATYLNRILLDPENHLFDFSQMAYQAYYSDSEALDLIDKLYFNHLRLGELREDIREAEPICRNSDIMAFMMSAIRHSDAPGTRLASPNGLYAEEACQLARYAGLSDKLSAFLIGDLPKSAKATEQTAFLAAQMIWYFLQGVNQRRLDYPFTDIRSYQKYIVNVPQTGHEIIFYRSPKTDRWWLEISYPNTDYPRSLYVACTAKDYQLAGNGEIPDRWWKNYQRIC